MFAWGVRGFCLSCAAAGSPWRSRGPPCRGARLHCLAKREAEGQQLAPLGLRWLSVAEVRLYFGQAPCVQEARDKVGILPTQQPRAPKFGAVTPPVATRSGKKYSARAKVSARSAALAATKKNVCD
ncbi:uncharacterized protein Tco025E_01895 [Trypanosoma conorhini]|uniref:Uncharacterized protein n=1 Tax=Trypanosoma conorhini TaxID=83891 RepID=A0A422Q7B5_9TRYP|nr:uncharacterized protein Tco025E_01895 [Trypanosoma conorhini]RNF25852.1 hypothetical protein Tco025E_01895 [Trypanosoma conorhini]